MSGVFAWLPLVWAVRISLLVLLAGCTYLYLLLIAPFFRPSNVRRMVRAGLPRVRAVGAEVAGTRGELHLAEPRDGQMQAIETKLEDIDAQLRELRKERHPHEDDRADREGAGDPV